MSNGQLLSRIDPSELNLVSYPDPVLRQKCPEVDEFGPHLKAIAERMWELMRIHKGVGLAAPQVGLAWRFFAWNPTGDPQDNNFVINPKLENLEGLVEAEEGCLSLDGVNVCVRRAESIEMKGYNTDGEPISLKGEGLLARIWQHESDHLAGRLLLDYMSESEQIANRRAVKQLQDKYASKQPANRKPSSKR